VGLEYRIVWLTCTFWVLGGGYDAIWYSLVSLSRIGLRRTLWSSRLITGGGFARVFGVAARC
jgi:hypothetical protein